MKDLWEFKLFGGTETVDLRGLLRLFEHGNVSYSRTRQLILAAAEADQAHAVAEAVKAAEKLCRIYFTIAANAIGEDEVRVRRDALLAREEQT